MTQRENGPSGVANWLIRPAKGWHHKARGMMQNRMFLPLAVIAGALLIALAMNAWILFTTWSAIPHLVVQSFVLWVGFLAMLTVPVVIYHHLVAPLFHLRHWAQRVRGGNLAARIPVPRTGEFGELARDVNALTEQLQRLTHEMQDEVRVQTRRMEDKSHTLEVLYDVAASINMSRDLDDLLTRFLSSLKRTLGARAATARLLTSDGQMRLVANLGFDMQSGHCRDTLPIGQCVCGKVVAGSEMLWKADVYECGRVCDDQSDDEPAMLAVPLQHQGRTLGVYSLFLDEWPQNLNEDMDNLLTSIGRHLGMAIEKARLDEEAQRLTIMEERTHLAHELHDSLAQTLASLGFRVSALDESLGDDRGGPHREMELVKENLSRANTELRELISQFRAPVDREGLVSAVEKAVNEFRSDTGISIYLQQEWNCRKLPIELETEVLRIVQEALCNVRKHADAQHVRVILRGDTRGDCFVMIEDDGRGIEEVASGSPGEHIGLSVMQERSARLDGDFRIETEPGEGTRVMLNFQYPKPQSVEFQPRLRAVQ
ncbi:Nitrate/nitrite sensor protein [Thioalkalivibrio nitratireducens DSM 14787]|uniref:Sensor protein n=2 Tax=Thioalkalivibrio nitratireducens TaxID=186931 RepID=L0E131_THIND|nr:Nitrate/nitrite sensor protein [Thioalkalivibrio nitratireducens DSM 14787]